MGSVFFETHWIERIHYNLESAFPKYVWTWSGTWIIIQSTVRLIIKEQTICTT